jgi:hypothetical protein
MIFLVITSLFIINNVHFMNCAFPEPMDDYPNHKVLIAPDIYEVYWRTTQTDVMFEVHSKNSGNNRWTAFGLSPTGEMAYSDIAVFGHIEDGSRFFSDCYINGSNFVLLDDVSDNNWKMTLQMEMDGYMVTLFTRPLDQCDESEQDLSVLKGVNHVIYAHGMIQNNNMVYHGPDLINRGHKDLQIYDSSIKKTDINDEQDIETETFIINVNFIY